MTTSIENDIEAQLINAITSSGVTGVGVYAGENESRRLLPYVSVDVEINSEDLAPFTGIFSCTAVIEYRARADTSTNQAFDSKFQEVLQAFYTEPNLAEQMTSASQYLTFYIANIRDIGQIVTSATRTWARQITMDIKATAK